MKVNTAKLLNHWVHDSQLIEALEAYVTDETEVQNYLLQGASSIEQVKHAQGYITALKSFSRIKNDVVAVLTQARK